MSIEQLRELLRYLIMQVYGIPASDTDIDQVATIMQSQRAGITKIKNLDLSSVETAGILQIEE